MNEIMWQGAPWGFPRFIPKGWNVEVRNLRVHDLLAVWMWHLGIDRVPTGWTMGPPR